MFDNHVKRNKIFAWIVLALALVLYCLTLAPTTSFWDAGEYIAVSNRLQVPHPPGAPFYLLLGRLFSMFMPTMWVAISVNFLSALASALTIMLLYLIIVRLIREWKGHPDDYDRMDLIAMYGGAIIGALTFAVTDTFWFSAVEAEVYALSLFFTAMVTWLVLKWSEQADQPGNERWLILIAYLFGLALGVHLLNLLAIFFVTLIIYFRKREFQIKTFLIAAGLSVITFLIIYPFTVIQIPGMLQAIDHGTYGLIGPFTFLTLVALVIGYAIYYTHHNNYRLANMILVGYAMILIGYSSFSLVLIRSIADPPIDENDPETLEDFVSYLKREQYGQTPLLTGNTYDNSKGDINREESVLFPRRWSNQPQHKQKYAQYSGDLSFFLQYQVYHMYVRYFNWNFIGRDSDIQDADWQAGFTETRHEDNEAHNSYYYLPFLLGLFGLVFHAQNDWKRALSVFALFFFTGMAIIIYLNQTPFQPRERDYAYVGSFFAFSIWIGMGATGIVELLKEYLGRQQIAAYSTLGLLFLAVPLWMLYQNYEDSDRSERYVANDYARNLLKSTAPNSILFTNGDNDTFPLWYAQEVEGVRTDVRIVCLSLLNTDWYIKQLKNQWSHESPPLPISYSNEEIDNLEDKFQFNSRDDLHQPKTYKEPVDKEYLKKAFSDSTFYRNEIGIPKDTSINVWQNGIDFGVPLSTLDDTVSWYFEGQKLGQDNQGNTLYYTRIQTDLILDIIQTNNWLRPIYFANTVSRDSQLNLQPYFRLEGQAYRLVPDKHSGVSYGWIDPPFHTKRLRKFQFREMDNPDAYFNENIRRMLDNYRFGFTQLADSYIQSSQPDSAKKWLDWGRDNIPFTNILNNSSSLVNYAYKYAEIEAHEEAVELANLGKTDIFEDIKYQMDRVDKLQQRMQETRQKAQQSMTPGGNLRSKLQNQQRQRKRIVRQISQNSSHLMILQRIYFMAGENEQAVQLGEKANEITQNRVGFPTTEEENRKRVNQMYMP